MFFNTYRIPARMQGYLPSVPKGSRTKETAVLCGSGNQEKHTPYIHALGAYSQMHALHDPARDGFAVCGVHANWNDFWRFIADGD